MAGSSKSGGGEPGLVSVVIAAYNAARWLDRTLHSARRQTYSRLEILVVDDGSTDATPAVVAAHCQDDPRVRLFGISNSGVGAARNHGIAEARGEWIAPLDADDCWHPEKIARQVARMQAEGPGMPLVYCLSRSVDAEDRLLGPCPWWNVEGEAFEALLFRNFIGNASVPILRTADVRACGGYLTRRQQRGGQGCEDWDLALQLAARGPVGLVRDYLSDYRQLPDTMSLQTARMATSYRHAVARARAIRPETPPAVFQWSAGHFYGYLAMRAYIGGAYASAQECVLTAWKADSASWWCPALWRAFVVSSLALASDGRLTPQKVAASHREQLRTWTETKPLWWLFNAIEDRRWRRVMQPFHPEDHAEPPPLP